MYMAAMAMPVLQLSKTTSDKAVGSSAAIHDPTNGTNRATNASSPHRAAFGICNASKPKVTAAPNRALIKTCMRKYRLTRCDASSSKCVVSRRFFSPSNTIVRFRRSSRSIRMKTTKIVTMPAVAKGLRIGPSQFANDG